MMWMGNLGTTTWLFLDNQFYVEAIGFLAVFFEALLGTPQFLRNFRLKSTEGMSVKMVTYIFSLFLSHNSLFLPRFSCGHQVIYSKLFISSFEVLLHNSGCVVPYKSASTSPSSVKLSSIRIKTEYVNHETSSSKLSRFFYLYMRTM